MSPNKASNRCIISSCFSSTNGVVAVLARSMSDLNSTFSNSDVNCEFVPFVAFPWALCVFVFFPLGRSPTSVRRAAHFYYLYSQAFRYQLL